MQELTLAFETDATAEPVRASDLDDSLADLLIGMCEAEARETLARVIRTTETNRETIRTADRRHVAWIDVPALLARYDELIGLLREAAAKMGA